MAGTNFFTKVTNASGNTEYIAFTDETDLPSLVRGTVIPTAGTYAKGCLFIKTDAANGTKSIYENQGTTTSPSFNLVGEITAGEIALPNGDILIGDSAGVGSAQTLSGDVTITDVGVATIGTAVVATSKIALAAVTQSILATEIASMTVLAAATTGTMTVTAGDIIIGYSPTAQDTMVQSITLVGTTLTITLAAAATANNTFDVVLLKA